VNETDKVFLANHPLVGRFLALIVYNVESEVTVTYGMASLSVAGWPPVLI